MEGKIYLLLFVLGPVASVPLSSLQLSIPGINEYDVKDAEEPQEIFARILEAIKDAEYEEKPQEMFARILKANKDAEAAEEPQDIFARILEVNKGNTMDVIEGDILLTKGRSATNCTQCLWPKSKNGKVIVPYTFGSDYELWERRLFKTSMDEFESLTCVKFQPWIKEVDYLNIVSSRGCRSIVGKEGGAQTVSLDRAGCMSRGMIQHELNHALGFYHEHMRSDRNNYVTIMYQNIAKEYIRQFSRVQTNNLGLEYDYQSVMHYGRFTYTDAGEPTIVPIPDPNIPIGQKYGLSVLDVSKINRLYECDVCANLLNSNSGSLRSANYPSNYPNDANCVWLIRTPSGQVALNFVAFDVQSSPDCVSDYMKIYDGPTKDYPLVLDRTCGTGLIPPIIASSNQLLVEFSSDSSVTAVGFRAEYSSVKCGGTFYTPQRSFTSPGYPYDYGSNLNCTYTITAPVGKLISIKFNDFDTHDRSCQEDFLQIRDGSDIKGPYCGNVKIPSFTSMTNSLILTFISDERRETKGFWASYKFI